MRLCGIAWKADDPWMSKQTILKRIKADDLRAKEDDPGLKQRSLVKADDLSGAKQTIFESKQTIPDESRRSKGDEIGRSHIISKATDLWVKADDPKGSKWTIPNIIFKKYLGQHSSVFKYQSLGQNDDPRRKKTRNLDVMVKLQCHHFKSIT